MSEAEESAFRAYAVSRRPALRRSAYLVCGDWRQADDLVQTTLTKLFIAWRQISSNEQADAHISASHPDWHFDERVAQPLDHEPAAPFDMDRIVASGRRARRRRVMLTAVAGTACAAAVTAAIVVPMATSDSNSSSDRHPPATSPSPSPTPACEFYIDKSTSGSTKVEIRRILSRGHIKRSDVASTQHYKKVGGTIIQICLKPGSSSKLPGTP